MPDLTVSSDVDSFMAAANKAAMLAVLNITLGGAFTTSGAFTTTLTVTGNTNVTLPTSGTLAVLGGNAFTGACSITVGTNSPTPVTGFSLINSSAATNGTQSASPIFIRSSNGYKTNATAASQNVTIQDFVLPVQGAANPTGLWKIQKTINSESAVDILTLLATAGSSDTTLTIGGSSAALSITTLNGFYATFSISSGGLRYSVGGIISQYVDSNRVTLGSGIPLCWSSTTVATGTADVILNRDAADTLALRNSTNAQTLRIYGTYTDASNYVRASLKANSSLVTLSAETAGTGADNIDISIATAGTGLVDFSTQSASVDVVAASTHTFRMKIGGTEYKVLIATP